MESKSVTEAKEILQRIFCRKTIVLMQSGDHAIASALALAKNLGRERVFIQDQGGWLTYRSYPKKLGLQVVELKTDYGLLILSELEKIDGKSALLVNSLSGYFAEQQMDKIAKICKRKNCILINDASGSIGTDIGKIGDIILCSFGKDKPVNLYYGGCIAYDIDKHIDDDFDSAKAEALVNELKKLPQRIKYLEGISEKVKDDLRVFDIIHCSSRGINVLVRFKTEGEKQRIIDYCKQHNYEYTICPRYIRVNENAVSIEVKRLKQA